MSGITRPRSDENLQTWMLGRDWRILARAWLGHDGRSKSEHARLDHKELSRPSYYPSPIHWHSGRIMGWTGEERQGELHLRISSVIHDFQMRVSAGSETVSRWIRGTVLWVYQRLSQTNTPGG